MSDKSETTGNKIDGNQAPTENKDTCPVCGQPYDHSLLIGGSAQADFERMPEFRSDVVTCESPGGHLTSVYVHYDRRRVVSEVRSSDGPKSPSAIRDFFGWDE